VLFVETPVFSKELSGLLSDDEYHALQLALLLRPEQGKVIPKSGGLRKLRWKLEGRGKRGGARVIYFWDKVAETVYMLLIYDKADQEDLTPSQLKILRSLVREGFR